MLYAAIDIHKHAFQAAVLDPESGEVVEERFSADRESLARWAETWRDRVAAVAIEATTGWRWVWRELAACGFEVRLAEPVQARGLLGRRRSAKTDRLDARWLARLLAKEMLPESWIPPEEIQRLRDRTRLRKALAEDRRRWGQRLHAFLLHEGWPCSKARLLTPEGLRWAAALTLPEHARLQVDSLLAVIGALEAQLDTVDAELRRFARADARCRALQSIYGIGPILACHLLAEIGEASRFRRAEQITRLAGLDPVVDESGETRRRGKLAKAGSPHLRWISWMGPPAAAIASRPRQLGIDEGGPNEMVYAAIDIHKRLFQAAVLDAESGELRQERLPATREALDDWATRWQGKLEAVALEATTGWRWVARELQARGVDVRLCDPGEARALGGSKRRPKTDRLDAAWLARLLAKEMLPEAWLPPAEIQYLRDRTRLRHALARDRNRWAQRLHALLTHEGWPCGRGRLLTVSGQRWASALSLPAPARASVEAMLAIIHALDEQIELLDGEPAE
jgi:transposase